MSVYEYVIQRLANLQTDPERVLQEYHKSISFIKSHDKGEHDGTSIAGEHWREVHRQRAVTMGNRYKKLTGNHPEEFETLKK